MRRCPRCGQDLPEDQFYGPYRNGKRTTYCKPCVNAMNRVSYLKTKTERNRRIVDQRRAQRLGLTYEEYAALGEDPGTSCAVCGCSPSERRNGMFRNDRNVEARPRRLAIDHDHETGTVRGFLCAQCNQALGLLDEDPALIRSLATYIENAEAAWAPHERQPVGAKRRDTCPNGHPWVDENLHRFPSGQLTCAVCRAERRAAREARKVCKLHGCNRKQYGHGFCRGHMRRWQKYGDPLAGRAENGTRRTRKQQIA